VEKASRLAADAAVQREILHLAAIPCCLHLDKDRLFDPPYLVKVLPFAKSLISLSRYSGQGAFQGAAGTM
jgi:hypothetical protein